MKLTESQLRKIIREELEDITPITNIPYYVAKQEPVALHVHEAFGLEPAHAVSEIIADADTGKTLEVYGSNRFYDDGTVTRVRFGNMFTLTLDENDLSKLIDLLQRLA